MPDSIGKLPPGSAGTEGREGELKGGITRQGVDELRVDQSQERISDNIACCILFPTWA